MKKPDFVPTDMIRLMLEILFNTKYTSNVIVNVQVLYELALSRNQSYYELMTHIIPFIPFFQYTYRNPI
jgi:TRAP-type mannitol/chloroaromatic compound transport system permease small subunit